MANGSASLYREATSTTVRAYLKVLRERGGRSVGDTEDRLGELCLEQEHQIFGLGMYRGAGK